MELDRGEVTVDENASEDKLTAVNTNSVDSGVCRYKEHINIPHRLLKCMFLLHVLSSLLL